VQHKAPQHIPQLPRRVLRRGGDLGADRSIDVGGVEIPLAVVGVEKEEEVEVRQPSLLILDSPDAA